MLVHRCSTLITMPAQHCIRAMLCMTAPFKGYILAVSSLEATEAREGTEECRHRRSALLAFQDLPTPLQAARP